MAKFFLLHSFARHGKHMTRSLLNQHPDICLYDELMLFIHTRPWQSPFKQWRGLSPQQWFQNYHEFDHAVDCVGMTVHSDQVVRNKKHNWRPASELRTAAYPTIELFRKNLLESFASHTIAARRDAWCYEEGGYSTLTFNFKPTDWQRYIRRVQSMYTRASAKLYREQPVIRFWYEDVVADPVGMGSMMQEFLGVEPRRLEPTTKKQERRSMEEVFRNWDVVVKTLTGTFWEGCLHGDPPLWLP